MDWSVQLKCNIFNMNCDQIWIYKVYYTHLPNLGIYFRAADYLRFIAILYLIIWSFMLHKHQTTDNNITQILKLCYEIRKQCETDINYIQKTYNLTTFSTVSSSGSLVIILYYFILKKKDNIWEKLGYNSRKWLKGRLYRNIYCQWFMTFSKRLQSVLKWSGNTYFSSKVVFAISASI